MGFGFVVDDRGPDKASVGGAVKFAARLAEHPIDEPAHRQRCPSCKLLAPPYTCVGLLPTPITAPAERWLIERLPKEIETVAGFLLRKAIGDFGYDGARARTLRSQGRLEAKGAFERHYGPFYRRFVVSSEQLLEELVCAGDIAPSHALAILIHLGALELDGSAPDSLDTDGPKLGQLIERPLDRKKRTRFALEPSEGDDASLAGLKAMLAALWAGFVLDADVFVIDPEAETSAPPAA